MIIGRIRFENSWFWSMSLFVYIQIEFACDHRAKSTCTSLKKGSMDVLWLYNSIGFLGTT